MSFLCKTIDRDGRSLVRVVSLDDDGGDACSSFISVSPIKEAGTLLIRQPYTDGHSTQLTVIGLIDVGWDGQCTRPYRR